jgi:hypothetical protein
MTDRIDGKEEGSMEKLSDNAQNDMISEALSQRMDRAGFRM